MPHGETAYSLLAVIRDKADLVLFPPPPKKMPVTRVQGPGLSPEPHTVLMIQSWSGPRSPSMEGVMCVGPWGVNQSPGGLATSSHGLRLARQSPTTQLCGLIHQFIHSHNTHSLYLGAGQASL